MDTNLIRVVREYNEAVEAASEKDMMEALETLFWEMVRQEDLDANR